MLNITLFNFRAGVAQLVEQLICNQRVGGSNPFTSFFLSLLSSLNLPFIRESIVA